MSQLSRILREAEGNRLLFWCPGCNMAHCVTHGDGPAPRWTWNGDAEQPTFWPSILIRYAWGPRMTLRVCHSFVTGGCIKFEGDSTHHLSGKTVELPPWPQPKDRSS